MNTVTPVIHDSVNKKHRPPTGSEVINPDNILSQDAGQQLQKGVDNGVLAKGLALSAAWPQAGDLCDVIQDSIAKNAFNIKLRYAKPGVPGGWTDEVRAFPMATASSAGLMSGADKESLAAVVVKVDSLSGISYRLDAHTFSFTVFSDDTTIKNTQEAEITAYALAQLSVASIDDIPDNTAVHNLNGGHLFRWNATSQHWIDDGNDVVGIATATNPGIVKGDSDPGQISIELDGSMTVNGWAGKEDTVNKTSTLGSGSTTEYPNTQAVVDGLAGKENTANKVTALSGTSTDTQYPSAKAVYNALDTLSDEIADLSTTVTQDITGKEDKVNKVTSDIGITVTSTDVQYASAKAVWELLQAFVPKGGAKAVLLSPPDTRAQDYATNANYTVPNYTVGANQLTIYLNGLHCARGQQYNEVGTAGTTSTTIQLLHPLRIADAYNVEVW